MVNFVSKRLQVFVSSTYTDLITERQAAVEAILTAGHFPAGMELFTSGDESQMEVINQWIDESDVYLLILGGRYGSVEPKTGKSYTQLEYEYALKKGKPLFACVITDQALENKVKANGTKVIETVNPQKLQEFRSLVLTKMIRYWDDHKDIKIAIGETLSQFSRREELVGWVRSNQEANMPALADEIARLSKENAELRLRLTQVSPQNSSYDPAPTWRRFFEYISYLIERTKDFDYSNPIGREYAQKELSDIFTRDKSVIDNLVFDATGTSTESLIPKARELIEAIIENPDAASQVDNFRLLVATQLRKPNGFIPS